MSLTIQPNMSNLTPVQEAAWLGSWFGGTMEDLSWIRQTQSSRPLRMTGLHAAPDYREKVEGQPADAVAMEQGYQETFLYEEFGLRVPISNRTQRELGAGPAAGAYADYFASFADSSRRRIYTTCFNVLNNAFDATNFAKGDGQALCDTEHPSNVGLQSNRASAAPTFASLQAGDLAMRQLQGHDGQRLGLRPAVVISGTSNRPVLFDLLNAQFDAADDRTALNYVGSLGLRPIISDYITDSNAWFLMSEQAISRGILRLNVFEAPSPRIESVVNTKRDIQILDEMEMESGSVTWRGIYGSTSS